MRRTALETSDLITEVFLANGGREGLYRQEMLHHLAAHHIGRATLDRWATAQVGAGRLVRTHHGRQSYLYWSTVMFEWDR